MTRNNAFTVKVYERLKKIYKQVCPELQIQITIFCMVHTCQGNIREIYFFQGQGIVRKFCDMSGKIKFCKKIQGIHISAV